MSYECHSAGMNTGCLLDALQKAFQIELGENVRCFCAALGGVLSGDVLGGDFLGGGAFGHRVLVRTKERQNWAVPPLAKPLRRGKRGLKI
ncbi:hypothetical protein M0804_006709 [Polistes exclamans]|nr:hypothetical protein M0804_006709 [Polistes exclamans]